MVQDIKEAKFSLKNSDDTYYRYQHSYNLNTLNSFAHYDCMNFSVNNIRRVDDQGEIDYQSEDIKPETKPAVLWNLDSQNKRKASFCGYNYADEPLYKKSLFDDNEDEEIDSERWRKMPILYWDRNDTKNWLIHASQKLRQPYREMSPNLVMQGSELVLLSRSEFLIFDRLFGGKLYDLLHKRRNSNSSLPSFDTLKSSPDDEASIGSDNYSDGESLNDSVLKKKRSVGRPRILDPKRKVAKVKLWEFIRNLLLDPQYCPLWICWEDYEKKRFRFVESDRVAKLWGDRKNNKNMTYEKFSRALRYYYPKNIFVAVPGRRLVYEFGANATGLETDCPNFNKQNPKTLACSKL